MRQLGSDDQPDGDVRARLRLALGTALRARDPVAASADYERHGHSDRADPLRREAQVLASASAPSRPRADPPRPADNTGPRWRPGSLRGPRARS